VELNNEALRGDIDAVKRLLDEGHDINKVDDVGRTALMVACKENRVNIALLLLERGADWTLKTKHFGMTAFGWAVGNAFGDHRAVLKLLELKSDPNERDKDGTGWSPLMKATAAQDMDTCKELLRAGADKKIAVDNPAFNESITAQSLAKRISRGVQNGTGLNIVERKQLIKLVALPDKEEQKRWESGDPELGYPKVTQFEYIKGQSVRKPGDDAPGGTGWVGASA